VPKDVPQRLFNEAREQMIREKKAAGPALFAGDERGKKPDDAIKNYEAAKVRDRAAETHRAELRTILERVTGERVNDELQSSFESQRPSAEQNGNGNSDYERHFSEAKKQYHDFDATIADADRAGVGISKKLETAIRSVGNPAEIANIAYTLAKNPALVVELEYDPTRLAQISPTARHNQLFNAHQERMSKADPDAVALVAAATDVPIRNDVRMAVLEQDNSEALAIHFARNPEVLEELNQLPPAAAVSRVGRIAAQLETKAKAQRVRVPEPIVPVGQSSTRSGGNYLGELSPREYIRVRNTQEYARKRGR
jgi:hypothetical protein